jgi:hypothetical protein
MTLSQNVNRCKQKLRLLSSRKKIGLDESVSCWVSVKRRRLVGIFLDFDNETLKGGGFRDKGDENRVRFFCYGTERFSDLVKGFNFIILTHPSAQFVAAFSS